MLAEIKMKLKIPEGYVFHQNKSGLFHGALMEILDKDYADVLHMDGVNPFSQSLVIEYNGDCYWSVRTLTKEAYDKIAPKLLSDDFKSIELKYDKVTVEITEKEHSEVEMKSLVRKFYNEDSSGFFKLIFESPTAFKVNGKYQFYPDILHIFQNLMFRYDGINTEPSMFDEETLQALVDASKIVSYRLHDERFGIEGVRIPSFKGYVMIKVDGAQTMKNFARLLLDFGKYSGIGIKTSLGMGHIIMEEKK